MREREGERAEVLLVDGHTLFREAVVELFAGKDDLEATGLASVTCNAHRSVMKL